MTDRTPEQRMLERIASFDTYAPEGYGRESNAHDAISTINWIIQECRKLTGVQGRTLQYWQCPECSETWLESADDPETLIQCPYCGFDDKTEWIDRLQDM